MGIIDGDFHSLIYPKILGRKVFWGVVDCFTRAYLCLAKDILNPTKATKKFYLDILNKPYDTYEKLINTIKTDKRFSVDSYYKSLNKIKDEKNIQIVSTNYTPCCSTISGIENIIHIHGRMDQFENPYEWKIINAKEAQINIQNKDGRKLLFPFLSIQSGVKPIIEETQISAYSRMVDAFNQAERIIIVGYGINYDDNHVNSIIRSAVEKGKEVIDLFYESDDSEPVADPDSEIRKRLRLKDKYSNLQVIRVDSSNSLDIFNKQLTSY